MRTIIVAILAAAGVALLALLTAYNVPGSPLRAQTELADRVARGDPLAKNSYYAAAVLDSANWFELTVVPMLAGVAAGVVALVLRGGRNDTLIVCAVGGVVVLCVGFQHPGRALIGATVYSLSTLAVASFRSIRSAPATTKA